MKILHVVGARPNFMKIAPIMKEMDKYMEFQQTLLHTGQHYDREMSDIFFRDLGLRKPDIYLGVGSGSHAEQTAKIMIRFEKELIARKPDLVMVVGDVNSTLACSVVAAKLLIPVAHVEAGLRSFDRTMPEEINRIVTDALSTYLFTTCEDANRNLLREGIAPEKIHFVGNVMIDTLLLLKEKADRSDILQKLSLKERAYAVLTLHRPSNVDNRTNLQNIIFALEEIGKRIPIVFPVHPRTQKNLLRLGLMGRLRSSPSLLLTESLGYLDFLKLMSHAAFVLTDSGGLQEETTVLGIPCLTLRENTERPVTIREGTNILVGSDRDAIIEESFKIIDGKAKQGKIPKLWDGKAAQRIVEVLKDESSREVEEKGG